MKLGSYDIIGNIAILPLFTKSPKKIAKKLISTHKNIKTVFVKAEKIKGRLRKRKLKFLTGTKTTETIHRENGCFIKMDIGACYFSPRLSNDRLLIAKKVKKGEKVLVMFAGVIPYALVIAKNSKPGAVYTIEINKKATAYAMENVKLNKLNNIIVLQGDVKKIIPKLKSKIKFDRIIMPRPQLKEAFLKEAFAVAKKNTTIHFYDFVQEDMLNNATDKIKDVAEIYKKKIRIMQCKKIGEISPKKFRIRIDFKVL